MTVSTLRGQSYLAGVSWAVAVRDEVTVSVAAMDRRGMVDYLRSVGDGVVATLGADGSPQSAYVSIAVTDEGELLFDAHPRSRKVLNVRRDPRVAVVVGGRENTTLQCQGVADLPAGVALERCTAAYLATFPQFSASLEDWADLVRVRVRWARWSDFRTSPPVIALIDLTDANVDKKESPAEGTAPG